MRWWIRTWFWWWSSSRIFVFYPTWCDSGKNFLTTVKKMSPFSSWWFWPWNSQFAIAVCSPMCCWLSGLSLGIQPWSCSRSKPGICRTESMVLTGFLPFWGKGMQEAFTDTEESFVDGKNSGKNRAHFIPGHHESCAPQCPSLPVRQRFPVYSLSFSSSAFGPSHQVTPA